MLDMGPYYLTALVNLIGSVAEVSGMTRATFPTRTITSPGKFGKVIDVEVATHVAGLLRFSNGAIGTLITSFDVWGSSLPRIEIYGTEGSLLVPDPNTFGGPVQLSTRDGSGYKEIPLTHGYKENSRGLGVADMAQAVLSGGVPRADGKLTCHVLEIMTAFQKSQDSGFHYKTKTSLDRPKALPMGLVKGYVR